MIRMGAFGTTLAAAFLAALAEIDRADTAASVLFVTNASSLAYGTQCIVTGTGLSTNPKAVITLSVGGKTHRFPVHVVKSPAPTDSRFEFVVTKGAFGIGQLQVTPHGSKTPVTYAIGLMYPEPSISGISTPSAVSGDSVTLTVSFLGAKKGKLLLSQDAKHSISAKVTTWDAPSATLVFVVPKGLKAGTYRLSVVTPFGASTPGLVSIGINQ